MMHQAFRISVIRPTQHSTFNAGGNILTMFCEVDRRMSTSFALPSFGHASWCRGIQRRSRSRRSLCQVQAPDPSVRQRGVATTLMSKKLPSGWVGWTSHFVCSRICSTVSLSSFSLLCFSQTAFCFQGPLQTQRLLILPCFYCRIVGSEVAQIVRPWLSMRLCMMAAWRRRAWSWASQL